VIILIIPKSNTEISPLVYPPLGLLYIASMLDEVSIYDMRENNIEYIPDAEFYGFTATTPQIDDVIKSAKYLRENTDSFLFIGGPHASYCPQELQEHFDSVIVGEAEEVIHKILNEKIKGITYSKINKSIDSIPFPARHLLEKSKIVSSELWEGYGYGNGPKATTIITSRGCPWKCSFCLDENTIIFTKTGAKYIKDIVENEEDEFVFSHDGTWNKIEEKFKRFYNGEVLKISSRGIMPIIVTPEHPFIIDNKQIEAKDLKINDELEIATRSFIKDIEFIDIFEELKNEEIFTKFVDRKNDDIRNAISILSNNDISNVKISRLLGVSRGYVIDTLKGKFDDKIRKKVVILNENKDKLKLCNGKWYERYIKFDEDFGKLCGLFLAEGCVCKCKNRLSSYNISFNYGYHEESLAIETQKKIKKCLGIKSSIVKVGSSIRVVFGSNIIGMLFLKLFGKLAYNKRIPMSWMDLPREKIKFLLNGYYIGDGYRQTSSGIVATTVSKTLAYQLVFINSRLGNYTRIREREPVSIIQGRKVNAKKSYKIYISDFNRFNAVKRRITNIEKMNYNGYVYNFSVKNKNTYTANSIKVHNCANIPQKVRFRSADNIIEEIKLIINEYDCKNFRFIDDNFIMNEKRLIELLSKLKQLDIKFRCGGRSNLVTDNICELLTQAGCEEIGLGIESADNNILKLLNKNETVEDHKKAIKTARNHGLRVKGFFMAGLPGETRKTIENNKKFIEDTEIDKVIATLFTPYPGGAIWNNPKKFGAEIIENNWNKYFQTYPSKSSIKTNLATNEELTAHFNEFIKFIRRLQK
jgi:radical SAM superfamily enzyme YgiQ (UPF0313 family)